MKIAPTVRNGQLINIHMSGDFKVEDYATDPYIHYYFEFIDDPADAVIVVVDELKDYDYPGIIVYVGNEVPRSVINTCNTIDVFITGEEYLKGFIHYYQACGIEGHPGSFTKNGYYVNNKHIKDHFKWNEED